MPPPNVSPSSSWARVRSSRSPSHLDCPTSESCASPLTPTSRMTSLCISLNRISFPSGGDFDRSRSSPSLSPLTLSLQDDPFSFSDDNAADFLVPGTPRGFSSQSVQLPGLDQARSRSQRGGSGLKSGGRKEYRHLSLLVEAISEFVFYRMVLFCLSDGIIVGNLELETLFNLPTLLIVKFHFQNLSHKSPCQL